MHFVRFSSLRVAEFVDTQTFERRVNRWLTMREGENSYLLAELLALKARGPAATGDGVRLIAIEEADAVVAVALLLKGECA